MAARVASKTAGDKAKRELKKKGRTIKIHSLTEPQMDGRGESKGRRRTRGGGRGRRRTRLAVRHDQTTVVAVVEDFVERRRRRVEAPEGRQERCEGRQQRRGGVPLRLPRGGFGSGSDVVAAVVSVRRGPRCRRTRLRQRFERLWRFWR